MVTEGERLCMTATLFFTKLRYFEHLDILQHCYFTMKKQFLLGPAPSRLPFIRFKSVALCRERMTLEASFHDLLLIDK